MAIDKAIHAARSNTTRRRTADIAISVMMSVMGLHRHCPGAPMPTVIQRGLQRAMGRRGAQVVATAPPWHRDFLPLHMQRLFILLP